MPATSVPESAAIDHPGAGPAMTEQSLSIADACDWLNVHPLLMRDWIRFRGWHIPTIGRFGRGDWRELRIPTSWV